MRLLDAIRALQDAEFEALARRLGFSADAEVRFDAREQLARLLVTRGPRPAERSFGAEERAALGVLARQPAGCVLPEAAEVLDGLRAVGTVYPGRAGRGEHVLPAAYRIAWAATPADPPRAARLLLAKLGPEAARGAS